MELKIDRRITKALVARFVCAWDGANANCGRRAGFTLFSQIKDFASFGHSNGTGALSRTRIVDAKMTRINSRLISIRPDVLKIHSMAAMANGTAKRRFRVTDNDARRPYRAVTPATSTVCTCPNRQCDCTKFINDFHKRFNKSISLIECAFSVCVCVYFAFDEHAARWPTKRSIEWESKAFTNAKRRYTPTRRQ